MLFDQLGHDRLDQTESHLRLGLDRSHTQHLDERFGRLFRIKLDEQEPKKFDGVAVDEIGLEAHLEKETNSLDLLSSHIAMIFRVVGQQVSEDLTDGVVRLFVAHWVVLPALFGDDK